MAKTPNPQIDVDIAPALASIQRSTDSLKRFAITQEFLDELNRAERKHGPQTHLSGTGPRAEVIGDLVDQSGLDLDGFYSIRNETLADAAKARCDAETGVGRVTWEHITTEEYFEALAEPAGSDALRTELVQTGAMILGWIFDHDRRKAAGEEA